MRKEFMDYLDQEKERCLATRQELIQDDRRDEADLCKIEANIYEVFSSLYQTSCKQVADGDEKAITTKFVNLANKIPLNWKESYEKAKLHNDSKKMIIEEIKLHAVDKIMSEYSRQVEE